MMFQCIFQNYLKTECVRRPMAITNGRPFFPQRKTSRRGGGMRGGWLCGRQWHVRLLF